MGNPVLHALRGCGGPYCHEYDHIVPFSKGGETTVENCQVLQTAVNRQKSNKTSLSAAQLKATSIAVTPSRKRSRRCVEREMDFLEYAAYGNVKRLDDNFTKSLPV